ncbi:MAG TPA: ornithine cyclodeaminase family protein [Candidatus Dormibacteraeota bacterium]|nr:ornithine cyclodeaminase family protein [Candidatus Dormibacteraeota bacterium]
MKENLRGTLLLDRRQISELAGFRDYFEAAEDAFRAQANGQALAQGLLHLDAPGGEFHVKAGGLDLGQAYFAFKINGGFYANARDHRLPNILGAIVLCCGETGFPLAVMESGEITRQRTAAAAALAATYLARKNSCTITICGCGTQGQAQLLAMKQTLPLAKAFVFDADASQRQKFVERNACPGMTVVPVDDLGAAVRQSDVCVTCTPSRRPFLQREYVAPGTFIAAIGADSPEKQELDPALLASNTVVVDRLEQCKKVGELHHAIESGLLTRESVHAELAEIVSGKKPGRISGDEIIIFDSTGTAVQDVAAAVAVYHKALAQNVGVHFHFWG